MGPRGADPRNRRRQPLLSDAGPSDIDVQEMESRIISRITNTEFFNRNRMIRQYRTLGFKGAWKYRKRTLGYMRGGR